MSTVATTSALALPEILISIGVFLDIPTLVAASRVCRAWHSTLTPLLPSGTLTWNDSQSAEDMAALLDQLSNNIHGFECDFKVFQGKALYYYHARNSQAAAWMPFKEALMNNKTNRGPVTVQKLVAKFGYFADEDVYPVLLKMENLQHVVLERGRDAQHIVPDVSKMFKVLGMPLPSKNLRQLTVRDMRWDNTGLPNRMQCNLSKIRLENVRMTEPNLNRLLQSCPALEELVALNVLSRWSVGFWGHLSKVCLSLRTLTFSVMPSSTSSEGICDQTQVDWLMEYLQLDLSHLGLHRIECQPGTLERLFTRFIHLKELKVDDQVVVF